MSQGQKLFERPKVRFSQPSEDSSINSENPDAEPFHSTSNKPRIKSIITLQDPIKIIYKDGDLPSTSKGIVDDTGTRYSSKPIRNAQSTSDGHSQRALSSGSLKAESKSSSSKLVSPNVQESSARADKSQSLVQKGDSNDTIAPSSIQISNDRGNSKPLTSGRNSKNSKSSSSCRMRSKTSASTVRSNLDTASKNTDLAKTGAIPKLGKIGARHAVPKPVPCTAKKIAKETTTVSDENSHKNPVSENVVSKIHCQKGKTPGRALVPFSSRSTTTARTVSCGLKISKPGIKTRKIRPKSSPVKKSILRDVNGHPTNVYVGPGIARYYSQPLKINVEKEMPHIRPDIVSGEELGRPEYNSIMCTISELRKVQSEKFVTDIEHLPPFYRNLVNEKVSAALDFSPDEAIYKNLVDLSVNENQLPPRVMRSKDPEPRHRDIVPKLSDFFTPTYSDEYCTAVQIRPSSPEIFSKWSAFAISDKIFGWKHDMDECY